MSAPRDIEWLYQVEHIISEVPEELVQCHTQDDYHRLEVKLQLAQVMALASIAERMERL